MAYWFCVDITIVWKIGIASEVKIFMGYAQAKLPENVINESGYSLINIDNSYFPNIGSSIVENASIFYGYVVISAG